MMSENVSNKFSSQTVIVTPYMNMRIQNYYTPNLPQRSEDTDDDM
jgi:hypothetical protein